MCELTDISIHALLAESDRINARYTKRAEAFLSTLSLRRATVYLALIRYLINFLSTLSLRRATEIKDFVYLYNFFSIHALLAESDLGRGVVV